MITSWLSLAIQKVNRAEYSTVQIEKERAIVEGVNLISKHTKPNAKSPQGGIVKREAPIHVSNLMLIDASGKPSRKAKTIKK